MIDAGGAAAARSDREVSGPGSPALRREPARSPQTPDESLDTRQKNALEFPVLSDRGNAVARRFGLVFRLDASLEPVYRAFGVDLVKHNGDASMELPVPATYVIAADGTIVDAFIDVDYRRRLDPGVVLRWLDQALLANDGFVSDERNPMIDLYTSSTPNGWKASIMLEEIGMPYTVHPISLSKGDQKTPEFLTINPNGRIPAIVDRANGDFPVFESGAILLYLGKKSGKLLPQHDKGESRVTQWLMFQMAGIGPMMGQANVFYRYFPEKIPSVIERYHKECRRLFEVLEEQLRGREYLCDDYSIADIANWCWVRIHAWSGVDVGGLDNLQAWLARLEARPACQRGIVVPEPLVLEQALDMAKKIVVR